MKGRYRNRFVLACGVVGFACAALGADVDPETWYERMREPWRPEKTGFIRDWLLLGEFPNPPPEGEPFYNHADPCIGCDTDYLLEHGGEEHILPVPGLAHTRPDGSTATWFTHTTPDDQVDLVRALEGRPHDNAVAYAYTTLVREEAGPARLAIGSDDGVMVWVNGELVHRNIVGRAAVPDNDIIPVVLHGGTNTVLIKVEQGQYGWGFICRLLDGVPILNALRPEFAPRIETKPGEDPLVVRTDVVEVPDGEVRVEVIRAGGDVIATTTVVRGQDASFATSSWPDGAYEVFCKAQVGLHRPQVAYLPWFKGDPTDAVQELLRAGDAATGDTPSSMILQMLAEMVRERLGGKTDIVDATGLSRIHAQLMEFEEIQMEDAGTGSRVHPSGFIRLAYRDEVDGSPQFCRVYLPHDFDPTRAWPVVIYLHGYNPENPRYVRWWGVDQRHHDRCDRYGMIYIEPHGRGNTGYAGIGERDVLRGLDMAQALLPVDEDRINLTGESMGGGGTWHVGTRNPERFAAISPIYGGGDYRIFMPEDEYNRHTSYEHIRRQSWSSFAQAEALLTTPVFVHHGVRDNLVVIENSRFAVRELQRWGYDVRYAEYPQGDHFNDMGHWPKLMPWLLEHRRNTHPEEVRVRAFELKDASAHWVQVEQAAHFMQPIHAVAKLVAKNTIRLDTENVLAVRLSPDGPGVDPGKPLSILWNGELHTAPLQNGALTLHAEGYQPGASVKRPERAGPIGDAKTTPFALVVGTTSTNEMMRVLCERLADQVSSEWKDWQKVAPRRFTDTTIDETALSAYSLLLMGGAEANAVTRLLADKVPLEIDGASVVLDGYHVAAPDAAVQAIYPSPWNTNRYVLIMAATSANGMFHHTGIPEDLDFCIHDGRQADSEKGRPAEKVYLLAGRFDGQWRVAEESLFRGDPEIRTQCSLPSLPGHIDADTEEPVLHLNDLLERNNVNSFRWVQRNANADGKPLMLDGTTYDHGLGVMPWSIPGSADWTIGGAKWAMLRGVIGVQYKDAEEVSDKDKGNTRVIFKVLGDGRELFVSDPFTYGTPSIPLELSISSVTTLTLVVHNEAPWSEGPRSANWADLRLERE